MKTHTPLIIAIGSLSILSVSCQSISSPGKRGSINDYTSAQQYNITHPIKDMKHTFSDSDVVTYGRALSQVLMERSRHNWIGQQIDSGIGESVNLITTTNTLFRLTTNQLEFIGLGGTLSKKAAGFFNPIKHPKVYYTASRRINKEIDNYIEKSDFPSSTNLTQNGMTLKKNIELHFHNAYSQIYFDDTADTADKPGEYVKTKEPIWPKTTPQTTSPQTNNNTNPSPS